MAARCAAIARPCTRRSGSTGRRPRPPGRGSAPPRWGGARGTRPARRGRRERAAWREAIRLDGEAPETPGARKRASDLGLIAGDLLFALGMRTLSPSGLDAHVLARAPRLTAATVS